MTKTNLTYGVRTTDTLVLSDVVLTPDLLILDGQTEYAFDDTTVASIKPIVKSMENGRVVAYLVTLDTLEIAKHTLETCYNLKQSRMISTDGDQESVTVLEGPNARTMIVLAVKHNNPQFNERYHLGVLNDQPANPRSSEAEQGGVDRVTRNLKTSEEMISYTLGELISIHTQPKQTIAIEQILTKSNTLSFLWRSRPPKPAPSPQAQANKAKRDAEKALKGTTE